MGKYGVADPFSSRNRRDVHWLTQLIFPTILSVYKAGCQLGLGLVIDRKFGLQQSSVQNEED